jgi:hypothetical protein
VGEASERGRAVFSGQVGSGRAVGQSASSTIDQVKGLSVEAELAELRRLVQGWAGVAHNSIIERVQSAEQREMSAQVVRMSHMKKPVSVSNKRK